MSQSSKVAYSIYRQADGEIVEWGVAPEADIITPDGCAVLLDVEATNLTHYVLDGTLAEYTDSQKAEKANRRRRHTWSNSTFSWTSDDAGPETQAVVVKNTRAQLLADSDWTQMPDVPLATKGLWAAYRQELRDITAQAGYPLNVIWPTPPQ